MASTVFRRECKSESLREFYMNQDSLPVIIHIDEGFMGFSELDNFGAGQYFFIHAIYRQKRVIARGAIDKMDSEKHLLSIPLGYPIPFRHVQSSTHVGKEERLSHLVRSNKFPFQCHISRTINTQFSVGNMTVSPQDISNLLLLGCYKEIYLLGNGISADTGSMEMDVVAIPLYLPQIQVSKVTGLTYKNDQDWMYYMDSLYAFALEKIDLHHRHGSQDICVIVDDTSFEKNPQENLCEYLVPTNYVKIKPPTLTKGAPSHEYLDLEGKCPPLPPKKKQSYVYEVAWLGPNKKASSNPQHVHVFKLSSVERNRLESIRDRGAPNKTGKEHEPTYEILTGKFIKNYTSVSELEGLKRKRPTEDLQLVAPAEGSYTSLLKREDFTDRGNAKSRPATQTDENTDNLPFVNRKHPIMKELNEELSSVCKSIKPEVERRSSAGDMGTSSHACSSSTQRRSLKRDGNLVNIESGDDKETSLDEQCVYYTDSSSRHKPPVKDKVLPVKDKVYKEYKSADKSGNKYADDIYQYNQSGANARQRERKTNVGDEEKYGQYTVYYGSQHTQVKRYTDTEEKMSSTQKTGQYGTKYEREMREVVEKPFEHMTTSDVCYVLKLLNLDNHTENFRYNLIDGIMLKELTEDILKNEFRFNALECLRMLKFVRTRYIPK